MNIILVPNIDASFEGVFWTDLKQKLTTSGHTIIEPRFAKVSKNNLNISYASWKKTMDESLKDISLNESAVVAHLLGNWFIVKYIAELAKTQKAGGEPILGGCIGVAAGLELSDDATTLLKDYLPQVKTFKPTKKHFETFIKFTKVDCRFSVYSVSDTFYKNNTTSLWAKEHFKSGWNGLIEGKATQIPDIYKAYVPFISERLRIHKQKQEIAKLIMQ